MKIGYLSDIHTEFMRPEILVKHQNEIGIETFSKSLAEAYSGCDVIVAAGDIATGGLAVTFLRDTFDKQPVIFVPGNHDYWGAEYHRLNKKMSMDAAGSNVHFFHEGGTIEIDNVLFVAATLWTDFALLNNKADSLFRAQYIMNDYTQIDVEQNEVTRKLIPADVMDFHDAAINQIKDAMQLAYSQQKKLVVVSHHAPSHRSLLYKQNATFYPEKTDPFYASNLDYLMENDDAPVLWLHGHTHIATSYQVGNTVVASNPKGYDRGLDTGWETGKSAII